MPACSARRQRGFVRGLVDGSLAMARILLRFCSCWNHCSQLQVMRKLHVRVLAASSLLSADLTT